MNLIEDFTEDILDDDGYPTEEVLEFITKFNGNSKDLMDFVVSLWSYPDFINTEENTDNMDRLIIAYSMATGGWSGNEALIGALQENVIWWWSNWWLSRRGGYYEFRVKL